MQTCPKCGYTRKPSDTAPDWQCPKCGIAYAKFVQSSRESSESTATDQAAISAPLSYADVPWYRKNWFVLVSFLVVWLWPILLIALFTGDLYYKVKDGEAKAYSWVEKALVLILMAGLIAGVIAFGNAVNWD